jgi:hypothetical protein
MSATAKIVGPSGVLVEAPKHVASGLVRGGYAKYVEDQDEASGTPDATWKVAELKAYADEHGVDLGDATKKADILTAIEAAAEDDGDESDQD